MSDVRETLQQALGDGYRIDREIGGGGMSRVFVATDTMLAREIVVKVLPPELTAGVNTERFRREIQLVARLQHAYIVPLLLADTAEGLPYYTMPFVQGESLRARLEREGSIPYAEALRIMHDIAEALDYAHENGVVHRDIKPANILLTQYHALVTDFGIAKALGAAARVETGLTSAGFAIGTPAYMAPEQATADAATDHRADIYSFGAVAYELLAGRPPFTGTTAAALVVAHAVQSPRPISQLAPAISPRLASLVMRCLEKNPANRPQTTRDVLDELEQLSTSSSGASPLSRALPGWGRKKSWIAAASAVLVLSIAAVLVSLQMSEPGATEVRLAVLPFENLGPAADQYFAEGIAEEIGNQLAGLPGLTVIGRSGAAHLSRRGAAPHEIGTELRTDYVLDGSVRWARTASGESLVRVIPQLIRVSTAAQVWGEPYEGRLAEVFALQTDIAEKVTQAVRLRLLPGQRAALRRPATTNVAAYDRYLLGRHLWKQRGPSLERATELFQEAIRLDSSFARAYSGLADSYILYPANSITSLTPEQARARAKSAALKALELDSTIAEVYTSLGLILVDEDYRAAYNAYRRAIELDPGYATAHQWYGELLNFLGRYEESIAAGRKAVELDPFSAVARMVLAWPYSALRKYDLAERELLRALEIDPQFKPARMQLARFYVEQGKWEPARRSLEHLGAAPDDAVALARRPRNPGEWQRARQAAMRIPVPTLFHRAMFLSAIGERELALDLLERSLASRDYPLMNIRGMRALDPLRDEPRFHRIVDSLRLSDESLREAGLLR